MKYLSILILIVVSKNKCIPYSEANLAFNMLQLVLKNYRFFMIKIIHAFIFTTVYKK